MPKQPSMGKAHRRITKRARKDQKREEKPNVVVTTTIIPPEIIHDILLRVSARSLPRLKDVCPSWRAIISDTRFIKSHLNQPNKGGIVSYFHFSKLDEDDPRPISLTLINRKASETETEKFWYPFYDPAVFVTVLGACNGLLLLALSPAVTLLWNPTTGECNTLALNFCESIGPGYNSCIYGLGYDSSLNEYKAVLLSVRYEYNNNQGIYYIRDKIDSKMIISSTSTSTVDGVDHDFSYCILDSTSLGITVNGAPHWVVSDSKQYLSPHRTIIYFDMADEKFKRLPTPSPWLSNQTDKVSIAVLEGCLVCTAPNWDIGHFDVWAMKEYGVGESWTKLFVIQIPKASAWSLTPLGLLNNGDEVVLHINRSKLVTYNLNTGEEKFIAPTAVKFGAIYAESLASTGKIIGKGY